MNLSVGIVGLPNVGKSTLFNALLKKQQALAANYPFATIEPNIGIVPVPDERLEVLAEITADELTDRKLPPIKPATVTFMDIAGLVKGASEGEGLGNKFLSHIREVSVICEVVRYFKDPSTSSGQVLIIREGSVDPESDKTVVNTELMLADLQTLEKQHEPKRNATKEDVIRYAGIEKLRKTLGEGRLAVECDLNDEERVLVRDLQLLTMKPILYVANVDEDELKNDYPVHTIAISAKIESELADLSDEEQKEYLKDIGLQESGLERLIKKAYEQLGLISFLTAGEKEVRAWTIKRGETASNAAGEIHTDFVRHFIKAEVVSFEDFVSCKGWKGSREAGKARMEGKEYVVRDGDVIEFKIGN